MSGLRQEGILQVNDTGSGGPGIPVEITTPIGQQPMADSVSVAIASDQTPIPVSIGSGIVTATGTITSTITPVVLTLTGQQGAGLRYETADFDGLLVIQCTYDGINWFGIPFAIISSGAVQLAVGITFTGIVASGNISFILPGGITEVRAATQTHNSGSIAVAMQGTATQEFTPPYVGTESLPAPVNGIQLGGAASVGGEFHNIKVIATNPGIGATSYGAIVVPWGKIDAGASATGYPYQLVAGRDPISNMMRQLDVTVVGITPGLHGLVTRPYMGSDGTNIQPTMDTDARRGFQEISRWLGSTAPTVGQKTAAASIPVIIASDQGPFPVVIQSESLGQGLISDGVTSELELNPTMLGMGIEVVNTGLTGTLTIEASISFGIWETIPFIDAGVIRLSGIYVADSGSYAYHAILPNGVRYVRMRMAGYSAGSTDLSFNQSPASPFQTWLGSVAPTVGQKAMASSLPVTIASDQSAIPVSGTVSVTEPVTVDAVDLDIRNLVFATDKVDVSGSTGVGVTGPLTDAQLRATPVPVSTSLTFADDKVDASGSIVSTKTDLTPSSPTAASVGVASAQVVAANATRKGLILINTSVNRISLGFGSAAVLNSGPTLYPGGSFNMDEYDFDLGAVNAIASAAASNLAIQEYST